MDERIFVGALNHIESDAALAKFLDAVQHLAESQRAPYAWIANLGPLLNTTATQRRMLAEGEKRREPYASKFCAGIAIFAPSPIARGLVTAVYWLNPPTYPRRIVSSFDEGVEFARAQLAGPIGAVG
ncbi:MAG: hypothetical protein H6718_07410 [Polyangiaceae bacterium]|nr:hypothetical protein [Polyangiaceae bacterium]